MKPLARAAEGKEERVRVAAGEACLEGDWVCPPEAKGIASFAHASGSSRLSPRNRYVAQILEREKMGTLLFDLLTPEEDQAYRNRFQIDLLTDRLLAATRWALERAPSRPLGYFGASTGAAAALKAAARLKKEIRCVVSRGGRPDLAGLDLKTVESPTLLIVGGRDESVLPLNQWAYDRLLTEKELVIVPNAGHLFEEPGALEHAAHLAADWFNCYFTD